MPGTSRPEKLGGLVEHLKGLISEEYERSLLGAILQDNRVLEEHYIFSDLFSTASALRVWSEIERLRGRGAVANILEVAKAMPDDAVYISRLTECPSAANVGFYYSELIELCRKRSLLKMARDITEMVKDFENTSEEIIPACERILVDMAMNRSGGYRHVSECMTEAIAEIARSMACKGTIGGIDTGFPALNEKTNGWQNQELIVIGARPGAGKTSVALNMATAAMRKGHSVGFFSAEMSAAAILKRMLADWADVEFRRLKNGFMSDQDQIEYSRACQEIIDRSLFINDAPAICLSDLVSQSRMMRRKEKVDIIFVDYLSLITNTRKNMPRHEQVAEISLTLKALARELDIPVIALSQLTREAQNTRPKLSQLRDSGAVEQDADIVALLWNQGWADSTNQCLKITFIMEKNRNGSIGDISMLFKPARMRFAEADWKDGK
jgi:replicative DNA helicase